MLQLKEGDTVEIHYELFQAASSMLTKTKKILFNFENDGNNSGASASQNPKRQSQGTALLHLFGFDPSDAIDLEGYLTDDLINGLLENVEGHAELQLMINAARLGIKGKTAGDVAKVLDTIIPHLRPEDFIFKKKYTIVKSVETAFGKWPQTYGNAFFTDSNFLVDDFFDMVKHNLAAGIARNKIAKGDSVLESAESLIELARKELADRSIDEMAMSIMGHLDSRLHSYIYDKQGFDRKLARLFKQIGLEASLRSETPIMSSMESQQVIEFMLNNVLATVIFFICFLSSILVFSLMQTDVEERKYEFAVLRTLGLRNRSLVTIISI